MTPFYDGFVGDIVPEGGKREGCFQVLGKIERIDDTSLFISELPIKKWTQDYKIFLESMMNGDPLKKIEAEIKDFKENHTDATVSFTVICAKELIDKFEMEPKGLLGKFKLTGSVSTSNMHLFDAEGRITKYNTPEDMLQEFFVLRLDFYQRRKALLLQRLRREQNILRNKARFIEEVCSGDLVVSNRKRADILADLQERGYDLLEKEEEKKEVLDDEEEDGTQEEELSDAELARGYEYLLGMKIWSLTYEKAEELRRQLHEKSIEVDNLEATAPSQLWLNDLDEIEIALDERAEEMARAAKEEGKAQKKAQKVQAGRNKKSANRKGRKEWESDEEESDDESMGLSDEENIAPKQKSIPKKPVAKKSAVVAPQRKPVPPMRATVKAPVLPPKRALDKSTQISIPALENPKEVDSDREYDLEIGISLADRMKKKLLVSPPPKRPNVKAKSSFEQSDDESADEFDLNMEEFEPASVTPAKKKAIPKTTKPATQKPVPPTKKAPAPPLVKKAPVTKAPRKVAPKKAQPKKKIELSDSDDEEDFAESVVVAAPVPSRSAAGRARAKVTYKVDDSDDDSDFE